MAAFNLQQTLILTTPLIFTGLAVAFAFRCGLFNIGGQGQYIVGAIVSVWVGSSLAGMAGGCTSSSRSALAALAGRHLGRDRRLPEGDGRRPRGDHDDHAQLDRLLGGELPVRPRRSAAERRPRVGPGLERRRRRAQAAVSGATRCSRGCTSASSSRSGRWSCSGLIFNRTTLGYEVRAVGYNPEAARYGGIESGATTSSRWRSPAASRASAGPSTSSAGSTGSAYRRPGVEDRLHRIAVALLGRNTAVGCRSLRAALRRAAHRHVDAQPRPEVFNRSSRGT